MTDPTALPPYRHTALPFSHAPSTQNGLRLGRRVIHQLRASLERDAGLQAATHLQEAGFAGGEELYKSFTAWLSQIHGVDRPADLDAQKLGEVLSEFLSEQGWGRLDATAAGPACWPSTRPTGPRRWTSRRAEYPSCHLSCGLLADFLGRISEGLVAVMEVECRSRGEPRCRFLAGAPETLGILYERMAQGTGYLEALAGTEGGRVVTLSPSSAEGRIAKAVRTIRQAVAWTAGLFGSFAPLRMTTVRLRSPPSPA